VNSLKHKREANEQDREVHFKEALEGLQELLDLIAKYSK
jgi:hypothetical protein